MQILGKRRSRWFCLFAKAGGTACNLAVLPYPMRRYALAGPSTDHTHLTNHFFYGTQPLSFV